VFGVHFTRLLPGKEPALRRLYLGGAVLLFRRKDSFGFFLGVFTLCAVIPNFFFIGTPVLSIPRLLLPAFPAFLGYAGVMRHKYGYWLYAGVCLGLAGVIAVIQVYSFFA
jgi:hypothetical protein